MSRDPFGIDVWRFALFDRPEGILLDADGLHHPSSVRGRGRAYTRYDEIVHAALTDRSVWLATRNALYLFPRQQFRDAGGADRLLDAILDRVGALPDGAARLARMAGLDETGRRAGPPRVTWGLAALCLAGFLLESLAGTQVFTVGYFSPLLVADGDFWRVVTANLLHGFPLHLVLNLIGLVVVGRMAERALGPRRTLCVMGAAALGSMTASGLLVPGAVVGVSGVVFGLAGAVLWLELRRPEELPAWWRFPRPLLRAVLVAFTLDVALGFLLPVIAGEAHLGGFLGGVLATGLLTRGAPLRAPVTRRIRVLAAGVVGATAVSVGAATLALLGPEDFTARHAARLAGLPGISPDELNNHAWFIAIDPDSSRAQMEAALRLAERAVAETGGLEATILDTLAEVQFQLGNPLQAIDTIDQAIARDPEEPYYREQRRRFTGERAADDRPPDPILRPRERREERPLPPDDSGITV